ncbi:MAG: hypothetical protein SVW02_01205 [Candidatus Nanohaloarchaea archaeon]|nr:hypothetical protein [Candidatus Nanohaloarchaea archaeon]
MPEFLNTTANLTTKVCTPDGLGDVFTCANYYTGGFVTAGFLGVVWFVVFNTGLFRGHRPLPSMIAANFVVTLASFILFAGGYVSGVVPFIAMVGLAGAWVLSYVYGPV